MKREDAKDYLFGFMEKGLTMRNVSFELRIDEIFDDFAAETGILKSKLVEQAARIDELGKQLGHSRARSGRKTTEIMNLQTERQAVDALWLKDKQRIADLELTEHALRVQIGELQAQLDQHEDRIATEFEATARCDDQTNEMFMEYKDGVFDDLDGGTTYAVTISEKAAQ
jgi:chromosome segregation ATPase